MKTSYGGRKAMFQAKPHFGRSATLLISITLVVSFFTGCTASPEGAYALKTADYGQCRVLHMGEKIRYKKRLVSYVCADDKHLLIGEPYKVKGDWYYKSARYNGKKVEKARYTKIEKSFHNRCQLKGSYGEGTQKIKKFYFDTGLKACRPYEWSGEGGMVPFSTRDECEAKCYY